MRNRFKNTNKLVTTFVILGIMLLIAFTGLVLIKNKTLTEKVYFETILDHAGGLSSKPPIFFKPLPQEVKSPSTSSGAEV